MSPIPLPETLGIPTSSALIDVLYTFGHTLNAIFMNLLIGSLVLCAIHALALKRTTFFPQLNRKMMGYLPVIALLALATIFMPLLTLQELFGHLLYTADISTGSGWLAILFMLVASIAFAGTAIMAIGYFDDDERVTTYGFRLIIIGIAGGLLAGTAYLITLPVAVDGTMVSATYVAAAFIAGGAILGILRPRNPIWGIVCAFLLVVIQFLMVMVGTAIRKAIFAPYFAVEDLAVHPQPAMTALFFICLIAALGAIAYTANCFVSIAKK